MHARSTNSQSITERSKQDSPETHPFHVGDTYANRQGKYEVVEIAPPKMTVRYENGALLVADIEILARIWENMHSPAERLELEPEARAAVRPVARSRVPASARRMNG